MKTDAVDLADQLSQERVALREGLHRASAAAGAADRELLRWALSCDRAELWRQDGCRNMAQWLSGMAGISNWKARRWVAAAYALEELVHISASLENGSLSLDKTVELTRFATPATEKKLISWARRVTVARIRERADEETRRSIEEVVDAYESRHLRWWWSLEGDRLGFEGLLPADQGAVWIEALDRVARELPESPHTPGQGIENLEGGKPNIEQRRADALVLLASSRSGDCKALDRTELVLHAPLQSLAEDAGNCSFGGRVLHPETARRLACDARIQIVLHGKGGNPVGIGQASQITPHWLRRQVFHRDGNTCTFPGCEARQFLTPHHIRHWARQGPTEFDNLVTVCSFHHTLVHELGWSVLLDREGCPVWLRPSGRRYEPGPAPPEEPARARPAQRYLLAEAAPYLRPLDLLVRLYSFRGHAGAANVKA